MKILPNVVLAPCATALAGPVAAQLYPTRVPTGLVKPA
jgi:hypothetical protein